MAKEGYLFIDHSASPGIPEHTARMIGLDPALVAEGKRAEFGTNTCSHCKTVVIKNPLRVRERASCFKCNHFICDICAFKASLPDFDHLPFDKVMDMIVGRPRPLLFGSPFGLLRQSR